MASIMDVPRRIGDGRLIGYFRSGSDCARLLVVDEAGLGWVLEAAIIVSDDTAGAVTSVFAVSAD
jgi:hypothetical protein